MKEYDPIKVRFKTLKRGNRSIYLDYKMADGRRKHEYLQLYLLAGRSEEVRRLNAHTLRAVAHIKAQRLDNLAWNKAANSDAEYARRPLFDVIDEYARLRLRRGAIGATRHYNSVKCHIARVNPGICLGGVNLDFVSALAENMMGQLLAKSTITSVISALGSVMKYAVRKGMVRSNPVEQFDMRRVKGPVYKRTYLIADELQRLASTPCRSRVYKRLFLFACFVGLRLSDLVSLRWSDIVGEGSDMRIEKLMSKTRHMVYIPLSRTAQSFLPPRRRSDHVFPKLPNNVAGINAVLREWSERAGIEKKVTFYTSRHTFATLSLTQGADLYSVSQLLGHKDIRTTEGYANIIDKKKEEAAYMMDALFEEYLTR